MTTRGVVWRCLVTNDDGIDSEGLRVLAELALEAGFEVVVAAPAAGGQRSQRLDHRRGGGRALRGRAPHPARPGGRLHGAGRRRVSRPSSPSPACGGRSGRRPTSCCRASTTAPTPATPSSTRGRSARPSPPRRSGPGRWRCRSTCGPGPCRAQGCRRRRWRSPHWETAAHFARRTLPTLLQSPPGTVLQRQRPEHPPRRGEGVRAGPTGPVRCRADQRGRAGRGLRQGGPGRDRRRVRAGHRRRPHRRGLRHDHAAPGGV